MTNTHSRNTHRRRHSQGLNMEDEWEEEEQLVVVELSGIINTDFVTRCRGTCKILDIDSERPMMQVGQYIFAGEYEDALGTCVLFEEEPPKAGKTDSAPELKYRSHTVRKLMMQRIFLTEKKEGETSTGTGNCGDQNNATCQPSLEESGNPLEESEEDNTDFQDSPMS